MIIKCIPGGIFLTNCYIIGDEETNEGILIDPGEQIDDILAAVKRSGLNIKMIVNTHTHIDHVAGAVDEIEIGKLRAKVLHTPGHTWGSVCLVIDDQVISGDTLFAGSVGRVDLTGGTSMRELVRSIKTKLMVLPDTYKVHPGHGPSTTIGIERRSNPFLTGDLIIL